VTPPAAIVSQFRTRLGNPTEAEISDEVLEAHLDSGLVQINRYRPKEATTSIALVLGRSIYDLPAGVVRIRRLYHLDVVRPDTAPEDSRVVYGDDGSISSDLAGLSASANWVEALEHRTRDVRDMKLYGGDWYIEAGKLVVSPAPSEDVSVLCVYPASWSWTDLQTTAASDVLEDLYSWALSLGFEQLSAARRRVKSVSRIGQATSFEAGKAEAESAERFRTLWESRYGRGPRVGPIH